MHISTLLCDYIVRDVGELSNMLPVGFLFLCNFLIQENVQHGEVKTNDYANGSYNALSSQGLASIEGKLMNG